MEQTVADQSIETVRFPFSSESGLIFDKGSMGYWTAAPLKISF